MPEPISDETINKAIKLVKEGYSINAVADHLGVSQSGLSVYIRIATGVKRISSLRPQLSKADKKAEHKLWRNPVNDISVETLEEYAKKQATLKDIGDDYGVSRERVRQVVVMKGVDYYDLRHQFNFKYYSIASQETIQALEKEGLRVTRSKGRKRKGKGVRGALEINGKSIRLSRIQKSNNFGAYKSQYYHFRAGFPYDFDFLIAHLSHKGTFLIVPAKNIAANEHYQKEDNHIYIKDCDYGEHNYKGKGDTEGRLCSCKYENRFDFLKEEVT